MEEDYVCNCRHCRTGYIPQSWRDNAKKNSLPEIKLEKNDQLLIILDIKF